MSGNITNEGNPHLKHRLDIFGNRDANYITFDKRIDKMTVNWHGLVRIGKFIVKEYPEIASDIIGNATTNNKVDLKQIPPYFHLYCGYVGLHDTPKKSYDRDRNEKIKVFISAMECMMSRRYGFNKAISQTLDIPISITSRFMSEVSVRYEKDIPFREKVDSFINKIT